MRSPSPLGEGKIGGMNMRYLPHTDQERQDMLARIGVAHVDDLFADVPNAVMLDSLVDLPRRASEMSVERTLSRMAGRNMPAGTVPFFCGAGAYKHHVPASVDHLIQRSEFLTSYTPYQPEIAQGTLQVLFEFQTQVAALTGMEVANASMYDGSTGTAEAVLMAHRLTKRRKAVLSGGLHPHYAEVVRTLSAMAEDEVVSLPPDVSAAEDIVAKIEKSVSCVVVQTPDVFGNLRDLTAISEACHREGALLIAVFTEAVSLGLLKTPGSMGADIVAGEGQSIGNALSFGGPYVGLFATREKFLRQMPHGRCGGARRLRADAVNARAAYPPRESDVEHLHQFRALRARLLDPHDPARRHGPAAARAVESRERREARRYARANEERRGAEQDVLQRVHAAAEGRCGAGGGAHGGAPCARRRAGVAASAEGRARRPADRREFGSKHGRGSRGAGRRARRRAVGALSPVIARSVSDEATQCFINSSGLLRFARNDGARVFDR